MSPMYSVHAVLVAGLLAMPAAMKSCDEPCTGAPVPDEVSAYTDCATYDVSDSIPIRLMNDTSQTVFYLTSCYEPPILEESRGENWVALHPDWECFCYCPIWVPLEPGEQTAAYAWKHDPGIYRASFTLGWGCWSENPTGDPDIDCERSGIATTEPYEIVASGTRL